MIRVADLFCGAGGETGGIVDAAADAGLSIDLAAVNHWQVAIETHKLNFPEARTYCHDLASLSPHDVFGPRQKVDLLWASPECTHHSNARGGRPCSDQSRASAWLILKWLSDLYVKRVILENVPEFLSWGPLGADGRPLESRRVETFKAFLAAMRSLGYTVDYRLLCAADYGDPTTRTRLFVQAVRGRGRIVWPEPTHAETPGLFDRKPWRPAREVIDWSLRGESIFSRARPLAPATMRRIEAGIRRYWGDWAEPFLVRFHGGEGAERRTQEMDSPIGTLDCSNRYGLVQPIVMAIDNRSSEGPCGRPDSEPLGTVVVKNRFALIEPFILHQDAPGRPRGIGEPVPTIRARNGHGLVEPFLVEYYGQSGASSVRIPLSTVTTKDHFALVEGRAGLDITFRMLQPHELAQAQGFPADYRFAGNKGDAVKQIGNAVPRGLARALALGALTA
jgi:DNA (cytosine-5)-methyltransferase 1